MSKLRIGVLASTRGTDMQALIDAIDEGRLDAEISVVISNKMDAPCLERAQKAGLEAVFIDPKGKERCDYDEEVMECLTSHGVELVVMVGYMRILSDNFIESYRNRIMNVHPSLLPAFGGGMDKDVHREVLDYGCKVTGCTIHFADETPDGGPIIAQECIRIEESDTVETLKEKVQAAEMRQYVRAVDLYSRGKLKVEGRCVRVLD